MSSEKKPKELTVSELITLINDKEGDFVISIGFGEEADENEKTSERIQA